jgi:hypothetical protein
MMKKKTLHILLSAPFLIQLGGCDSVSHWMGHKEVVLPSTPPLSTSALGDAAKTCKKKVEQLSNRKEYVPEERRKEFTMLLDLAEDNCNEMVETYERLKAATHQAESFRQNISHAESTVAKRFAPPPQTEMSSNNALNFDDAPQDLDFNDGEIFTEPLK